MSLTEQTGTPQDVVISKIKIQNENRCPLN